MIETKKLIFEIDTKDNEPVIVYGHKDIEILEVHWIDGHTEMKIRV